MGTELNLTSNRADTESLSAIPLDAKKYPSTVTYIALKVHQSRRASIETGILVREFFASKFKNYSIAIVADREEKQIGLKWD